MVEENVRVAKNGQVVIKRRFTEPAAAAASGHDRVKNYIIEEGMAVPPLHDMGVLTPDGRVVKGMAGKFRQINRYIELIDDVLPKDSGSLRVLDFGCGKSYLTFVLYHYFVNIKNLSVEMTGLDLKENVVAESNAAARKYGYNGLRFETGSIQAYDRPADMVVSLHACDTATDHALHHAIRQKARYIFAAPCCQHELNGQLTASAFPVLGKYGIARERFAALATDAIRTHLLTACGYTAQLLEFVDLTHTPKNLLIRAVQAKIPAAARKTALREAKELCGAMGWEPTLLSLLKDTLPEAFASHDRPPIRA
jgi:SAM-dependent methyltransferase